jgi:PPOX class probable FMN-dependent enzyme
MAPFEQVITSEEELRAIVGAPTPRSLMKERKALDAHGRAFIAHAPVVLIATSGADGRCDVSPKGDAPGFVVVLDEHRLAIPDRPGNKRLDGFRNIVANPHVGLIFLVPGREETLRVNGRAWISRDPELLARAVVQGKPPLFMLGVEVEECFMHCAKPFLRAQLWKAERWPPRDALPSLAHVLYEQIKPEGLTEADYARDIAETNAKGLY